MIYSQIVFPGLDLTLEPQTGFSLGPLEIHWYGVLIALGLMMAVLYGCAHSKHYGLKEDDIIDGVLCIVPFAVLCARLYFCAFHWEDYKDNLLSILFIWNGGLAIYGGVIGAAIGIVVFALVKKNKVKLTAVLDLTALGFLIGQSIGRWGNFFNREAFGAYTDGLFAMRIPRSALQMPDEPSAAFLKQVELLEQKAAEGGYAGFIQVHPTFLYESVWNLAGFLLLHLLSRKRKYDGQIALGYVAWYGLGRTMIEGLRMDSLYIPGTVIRVSQLLAALSCFAAVMVLVIMMFRQHDPSKLFVNVVAAREAAAEAAELEAQAGEAAEIAADENPEESSDE